MYLGTFFFSKTRELKCPFGKDTKLLYISGESGKRSGTHRKLSWDNKEISRNVSDESGSETIQIREY